MKQRILIISPKFPYPAYGACEQDRAAGIEMLIKMGHEVSMITKVYNESYKAEALATAHRLGITIVPVSYKYLFTRSVWQKIWRGLNRLVRPWYLDGAAYEYSEPEIKKVLIQTLDSFKPTLVWADYTYLWPLYGIIRKRKIPIITRSINFEPRHFLEEDGRTPVNYLKFIPKLLSEYIACKKSSVVCAITPNEAKVYERLGARKVIVLPLRSLPRYVAHAPPGQAHAPLNVFFSGSTYNVVHNRRALEFLLQQVIPMAQKQFPGEFTFNIFGGKVPSGLEKYFSNSVIKHGYLETDEFEKIMSTMDIAIMPSLYGAGMQQKIFEPLARGLPTITSARGLAGYEFVNNEHLLLADTANEFVKALGIVRDSGARKRLGENALRLARELFSGEIIERLVAESLSAAVR